MIDRDCAEMRVDTFGVIYTLIDDSRSLEIEGRDGFDITIIGLDRCAGMSMEEDEDTHAVRVEIGQYVFTTDTEVASWVRHAFYKSLFGGFGGDK